MLLQFVRHERVSNTHRNAKRRCGNAAGASWISALAVLVYAADPNLSKNIRVKVVHQRWRAQTGLALHLM